METLIEKLHPKRFTEMSPRMAALVACVLDQDWVTPRLVRLYVTSDGFLLGRAEHDCAANCFIGTVADWDRNWEALLDAADLTDDERVVAEACRAAVTQDSRC